MPAPKKQHPRLTSGLHTHIAAYTQTRTQINKTACTYCQYRYNIYTVLYAYTHICTCTYMFMHWANPSMWNVWVHRDDCMLSSTKHITYTQVLHTEDRVQHLCFMKASRGMKSSVWRRFSKSKDFTTKLTSWCLSKFIFYLFLKPEPEETEVKTVLAICSRHTSALQNDATISTSATPSPLQTLDTWSTW